MLGILGLMPAWLQWTLMAGAAAFVVAAVYSYNGALTKAERLQNEVQRLETDIDRMKSVETVLRANLKQKDAVIAAMDQHKDAFGKNLKEACELWEKVKDSENPVDDVLEALKEKHGAD